MASERTVLARVGLYAGQDSADENRYEDDPFDQGELALPGSRSNLRVQTL
jgi:hypothetical protein